MRSGNISAVHFDDLAARNTNGGVVGREIVICDFAVQKTIGGIGHFPRIQIGAVCQYEIIRNREDRCSDLIPIHVVIEAFFKVDTALVGNKLEAAVIQTAVDENDAVFISIQRSYFYVSGVSDNGITDF